MYSSDKRISNILSFLFFSIYQSVLEIIVNEEKHVSVKRVVNSLISCAQIIGKQESCF